MPTLRILFIFLSYIAGSIPFGVIISRKTAGIDITRKGSGNIGATNVARELGLKWGMLTLLFDLLKGFIPVFIVRHYFTDADGLFLISISLAVLLGHRFSPFLEFTGGKGVAAAFGIFLALSPVSAAISLLIFLVTVYITDYVSLGSIIGVCTMPVTLSIMDKTAALITTAFFTAALILITHSSNIYRIIRGDERKWKKRNHVRTSSKRPRSSSE